MNAGVVIVPLNWKCAADVRKCKKNEMEVITICKQKNCLIIMKEHNNTSNNYLYNVMPDFHVSMLIVSMHL